MLSESSGGGGASSGGGGQAVSITGQNGHFIGSGGGGRVSGGGQAVFPNVQQNTNSGRGSQEYLGNGQMNISPSGGVRFDANAGPKFYGNVQPNVGGVYFPENGKSSPKGGHNVGSRGNPNGGMPDGSEFNRHTSTSPAGEANPPLGMNGVLFNLDVLTTRTTSPSRMSSTDSLDTKPVRNGATPINGKGPTNGTGAHGPGARPGTTALADVHPKDPRPQRLASLCLFVTAFGALLALTSLSTSQWARVGDAAVFAGVCSALCFILALWSTVLSAAVFWMHTSGQRVLLKYKHATAMRMVSTGMAGFLSFVAVVAFVVEVTLVSGAAAGQTANSLSWGFYVQVLATVVLWVAGGISSAQWQRSRKLGGDPTMVNRDPQGIHAHTISNPNFKDDPSKQGVRTVSATVKNVPPLVVRSTSPTPRPTSPTQRPTSPGGRSSSSNRSMSPTGRSQSPTKNPSVRKARNVLPTPIDIHKSNGVSGVTGQPYMLGTQQSGSNGYQAPSPTYPVPAKRSIFDFNNKIIKSKAPTGRSRSPVGRSAGARSRSSDGRSPKNVRRTQARSEDPLGFVPFDPNRAPLRSSLRKPKPQTALPPDGVVADTTDGGNEEGGIPNPAFAQSSPVMKKKVRIHTQSTAV